MHYENERLVSSIVRIINEISYQTVSNKGLNCEDKEDYLIIFAKINTIQLEAIVSYVVSFLPYKIYLEDYIAVRYHMQLYIIQSIINILLQDDINDLDFPYHLENMKNQILFNLMNRVYITA